MLDDGTMKALFGALVAELHEPKAEFVSARNFYGAGLAAGLDMSPGDAGRRGPTLEAMIKSFASLPAPDKGRALNSMAKSLFSSGKENARSGASVLSQFGLAWDGNNIVA